jgi:hypothetical protein
MKDGNSKFKWMKAWAWVVASAFGIYFLAFICAFEVLDYPSRMQGDWLGPTPRQHDKAIDIGKVYHWEDADVPAVFTVFRPLCKAWLAVNGLAD